MGQQKSQLGIGLGRHIKNKIIQFRNGHARAEMKVSSTRSSYHFFMARIQLMNRFIISQ